ncbi:hypothetical protein BS78_05G226700 [Paspalum vaginatum]|nr:hypothetical protein BS78_05G226700 [Paspalum vaginatum]
MTPGDRRGHLQNPASAATRRARKGASLTRVGSTPSPPRATGWSDPLSGDPRPACLAFLRKPPTARAAASPPRTASQARLATHCGARRLPCGACIYLRPGRQRDCPPRTRFKARSCPFPTAALPLTVTASPSQARHPTPSLPQTRPALRLRRRRPRERRPPPRIPHPQSIERPRRLAEAMASRRLLPAMLPLLPLLLVLAPTSTATLHPVDYLALQSVRLALTDLPGSRFFASWDFTADPCGFAGVACTPDGSRVVALSLGDPRAGAPGLAGPLPAAALARLSALASLSLAPGRVAGPLPAALASLPALRFLALAGNLLSGPLPAAFAPGLRTLDLSRNAFSGGVPAPLLSLPNLRTLVLSHNRLAGRLPAAAARAPLVHLDLRGNRLWGPVPALPGTLVFLSLAGNRLSGRVAPVLRRLPRLAFLDLGRNAFSGEVPGEVFGIAHLDLRGNAFSGALRPAGRVPAGATVDLSHNALSGRVPPELAPAGALYLNGNRFTGAVPREVAAAAEEGRMRVLFLQDNFLTGVGVGGLPRSAAVCAHWNCVAPPPAVVAACPAKGGRGRRRPPAQCGGRMG